MRFLATLLVLLSASGLAFGIGGFRLDRMFDRFKAEHNKDYATEQEHDLRKGIFSENVRRIERHNEEYRKGIHTYQVGVNQFADLTNEEFVRNYLPPMGQPEMPSINVFDHNSVENVSETVDWREEGYVTEVKNQGMCGSCWAFSATGSIEGVHRKATGELVSLSEQNLVDCDEKSSGCQGGQMRTAFEAVIAEGGIDTEESYPYEKHNGTCRFNETNVGATISAFKTTEKGNEDALKAAVSEVGPISAAIDASPFGFQFYKFGIFSSNWCHNTFEGLNHGVLVVGYGRQKTLFHGEQDYWLIKNSWGKYWGQRGYIKLRRNYKNMCGVATYTSYPIV